jgi:hypothetical protein
MPKTVRELIEELQQYPSEAECVVRRWQPPSWATVKDYQLDTYPICEDGSEVVTKVGFGEHE